MKLSNYVFLAVLAIGLSSCGFKTEEKNTQIIPVTPTAEDDTDRDTTDDTSFKESIKVIEEGTLALAKDIPQGKILVAGILADEDSDQAKNILVPSDTSAIDSREVSAGELEAMNSITNSKTYINLGCEKIAAEKIEGLTEVKAKIDNKTNFFHAHAQKIFICSKGKSKSKHTVIYAQEIYMENSEFVFTKGKGLVNICAKKLILSGQNKISSTESLKNPTGAGSPIFLTVLEKIEGEGQLRINNDK